MRVGAGIGYMRRLLIITSILLGLTACGTARATPPSTTIDPAVAKVCQDMAENPGYVTQLKKDAVSKGVPEEAIDAQCSIEKLNADFDAAQAEGQAQRQAEVATRSPIDTDTGPETWQMYLHAEACSTGTVINNSNYRLTSTSPSLPLMTTMCKSVIRLLPSTALLLEAPRSITHTWT